MREAGDDQPPSPLGGKQTLKLLLPAFAASALLAVVGLILIAAHHRTAGLILVAIGALGGFVVRARIMIREQMSRRPPG